MSGNWEYKTLTVKRAGILKWTERPSDEECTAALNREGAIGWELVGVSTGNNMSDAVTFYLKRQR